jgi:hypothetical protein
VLIIENSERQSEFSMMFGPNYGFLSQYEAGHVRNYRREFDATWAKISANYPILGEAFFIENQTEHHKSTTCK